MRAAILLKKAHNEKINIHLSLRIDRYKRLIVLLHETKTKVKPSQFFFKQYPIPISPITARSESTRLFDNCKEKSREILDWLINKGIIT
jgi:hypothetical protein